jgi:hypothetical protein
MGTKPKYDVKDEVKNELKWDDLVPLYKDTSAGLLSGINALKEIGASFKDIIDNYKDVAELHLGIANTFADLTKELNEILDMHSKKIVDEKNGTVERRPFTGPVSNDEKHQEIYLYIVMAYGGINEKIVSIVDNSSVTLLGRIKEITVELEEAVEAADKKENDGKPE